MAPSHAAPRVPRQDRARVTREIIVDAAAVEFSRRGYSGASVNTILDASGRTKGAMYFHFHSKHALAVAVVEAAAHRYTVIAEPWRVRALHPVDALAGLIGRITDAVVHEPILLAELRLGIDPDFPVDAVARASLGWETVAGELATAAEAEGGFAPPFGPTRFVAAMTSMLAGGRLMAEIDGDPIALRGRFDESTDVVVAAMTTSDTAERYRAATTVDMLGA